MKIKDYEMMTMLLILMGLDTGANVNVDAEVPEEWRSWFETAEKECHELSPQEAEDLSQGSEEDQVRVREKAPYAYKLLDCAFDDGPLSELVFTPWGDVFEAREAEVTVAAWPEVRS
jgi:hypothetical protein